jgi:hypothetical protein
MVSIRARFFAAALLTFPLARAEEGNPSSAESKRETSVEAAKRDLQALPLAQKQPGGLDKLPSSTLPSATAFNLGEGVSPAPTNKAKSSTGFIDEEAAAFNSGLEGKSKGKGADSTKSRLANAGSPQETPVNPLAAFLPQWLSPQDLQMLEKQSNGASPGAAKTPAGLESNRFERLSPPEREPILPVMNPPGTTLGPDRRNPYLDFAASSPSPFATKASETPPLTGIPVLPGRPGDRVPSSSVLPPIGSEPTGGNRVIRAPGTELPASPPAAPPTAPIVDDRKYFPQLRRF